MAFLPEGKIVIGMRSRETLKTVESVYAAIQAEPFGRLPKKIDPPALVDAELGDVSWNVFVADFLKQADNIFTFDADHGVV